MYKHHSYNIDGRVNTRHHHYSDVCSYSYMHVSVCVTIISSQTDSWIIFFNSTHRVGCLCSIIGTYIGIS